MKGKGHMFFAVLNRLTEEVKCIGSTHLKNVNPLRLRGGSVNSFLDCVKSFIGFSADHIIVYPPMVNDDHWINWVKGRNAHNIEQNKDPKFGRLFYDIKNTVILVDKCERIYSSINEEYECVKESCWGDPLKITFRKLKKPTQINGTVVYSFADILSPFCDIIPVCLDDGSFQSVVDFTRKKLIPSDGSKGME